MTGYGSDTFHMDDTIITVEIRSVNSRYLDLIAKMPRSFHELELQMKKVIQTHFHRGRIELYITITGKALAGKTLAVDWELMDHYIEKLTEMKNRYNIDDEITFATMTTKEDFMSVVETRRELNSLQEPLFASITKAVQHVVANRRSEGLFLQNDIEERVITIKNMVSLIEERRKTVYHHYRDRIKQRIEDHIGNELAIDQTQLLQEIALLAEKGDIAEEITRLSSHLEHFDMTIIDIEEAVGRKLDFITQEMLREINTIGAKSVDSKISEHVVIVKSEIEKIKEQVQNVE